MLPVKATVVFDNTRQKYEGRVLVGHSWVYLVKDAEMYPREKIGRIELSYPFREAKEKIEKLL